MIARSPNPTTSAWEAVDVQHHADIGSVVSRTDRLAVPGGWLYRSECYFDLDREDGCRVTVAMAFVSDVGNGCRCALTTLFDDLE